MAQETARRRAEAPELHQQGRGVRHSKRQEGREAAELEGNNRRWRQERRGNRVSVSVEVLEATAMLEADAKPDSREHPGCKVWRAIA